MLLPVLMLLLGLLLQPACAIYTRSVMRGAAAECARVLATARGAADEESCRAFALRRLAAVPELGCFHVGGSADWQVTLSREEGKAVVAISGHLRPLPLIGVGAGLLSRRDSQGLLLEVRVVERVRPEWVEGGYDDWISIWR